MDATTSAGAGAASALASGEGIVFLILSAFVLGMALFCMTRRNPVTAVMSLVASFVGLSALYATLSAHFLSILQVLVYAGAIMVLFIFVVMILNREETEIVALRGIATRILALGSGLYLFVVFLGAVSPSGALVPLPRVTETFGTVSTIGYVLFRDFLFPFEAISLLLLVAIVGGVVVSRSERKAKAELLAGERQRAIAEMQMHDYPQLPSAGGEGSEADAHGHGAHAAGGH
jgi:NADH-quinone oxidoreductase subunit J